MTYRNRFVFTASAAMTAAMLGVAVYFLFFDSGAPDSLWDVFLALAAPCAVTWVLVRVGITPFVAWDTESVTVCNPFVLYRARLDQIRLLGKEGRGGAFDIEGIGTVLPWAMTRSVFDGKRANAARRDLRHAVLQAAKPAPSEARRAPVRRPRFGWYDVLIIPFLGAVIWAFLP
ncbi:hypothetical protein ACFW2Y_28945 [Streptomyces sp. NPDC058877]|uniref:hypothetical protein n=1 Tax=unclassified Streptomyces TaxID=2593676 RepID=UPI00369BB0E1